MQGAFQAAMMDQLRNLNAQTQQVPTSLFTRCASACHATPCHEPRAPQIEKYGGDSSTCRPFLTLCSLTFELQPLSYPTERSRVAFINTNLM